MREIKFRGKCMDKSTDEWLYGELTQDRDSDGKHVRIICKNKDSKFWGMHIEVNPETVGQYTGMKDRDGIDIYEGDLLEPLIGQLKGRVGVMEYAGDRFEMKIPFECRVFHYAIGGASNYFRIVGNIYENPELFPKVLEGLEYNGNRFQSHTIVQVQN